MGVVRRTAVSASQRVRMLPPGGSLLRRRHGDGDGLRIGLWEAHGLLDGADKRMVGLGVVHAGHGAICLLNEPVLGGCGCCACACACAWVRAWVRAWGVRVGLSVGLSAGVGVVLGLRWAEAGGRESRPATDQAGRTGHRAGRAARRAREQAAARRRPVHGAQAGPVGVCPAVGRRPPARTTPPACPVGALAARVKCPAGEGQARCDACVMCSAHRKQESVRARVVCACSPALRPRPGTQARSPQLTAVAPLVACQPLPPDCAPCPPPGEHCPDAGRAPAGRWPSEPRPCRPLFRGRRPGPS